MKPAEQIAEKLWDKYKQRGSFDGFKGNIICRLDFLSAIRAFKEEYGAAVRQRAAGVCRGIAEEHWPGLDVGASDKCAAAIESMELP